MEKKIVTPHEIHQDLCRVRLSSSSSSSRRKINKVPPLLRVENKDHDYDPMVVSIGPYHHGKKPEFQFMEEYKYKVMRFMFSDDDGAIISCYNMLLNLIKDVKSCYVEGSTDRYSDPELARMILLDGCFLLNLMATFALKDRALAVFTIKNLGLVAIHNIRRDIYLLENQIPLWILKVLATLIYGISDNNNNDITTEVQRVRSGIYSIGTNEVNQGKNFWKDFLGRFCADEVLGKHVEKIEIRSSDEDSLHLLELFRRVTISERSDSEPSQSSSQSPKLPLLQAFQKYLKSFISRFSREQREHTTEDLNDLLYSFRSVTDLKAKGILFKPSTTSHTLQGIKFSSYYYFFGQLHLPIFRVRADMIKVTYANMIAYELSSELETHFEMMSFVIFMKSLIISAEDVKELRERKILFHSMGTDEEVVKTLQGISAFEVGTYGSLHDVKKKIQQHLSNKVKTRVAELYWTYFSSPWSLIALLASILLLCLTFLQTYFTINPKNNDKKHTK